MGNLTRSGRDATSTMFARVAVVALVALFVLAAAEQPAQPSKPFLPMSLFGLHYSPFYSLLFNPYSFIGYFNPQMEMMPHSENVQRALDPQGFAAQQQQSGNGMQMGGIGTDPMQVHSMQTASFIM